MGGGAMAAEVKDSWSLGLNVTIEDIDSSVDEMGVMGVRSSVTEVAVSDIELSGSILVEEISIDIFPDNSNELGLDVYFSASGINPAIVEAQIVPYEKILKINDLSPETTSETRFAASARSAKEIYDLISDVDSRVDVLENADTGIDRDAIEAILDEKDYATKSYVDEKILGIDLTGDMFYWADDEHTTIGTKYNFFSEKENSAGGVGENIGTGGGGRVEVDLEMSDTSENAVANKVIKKYVDQRAEQAYEQANEYTNEEIASLREEIANSNGARAIELQAEWLDGQPHSFGMTWEEYIATPYIVFTFPSNNGTDIRAERIASCNRGPQYTDIYAATQIGESEPETSLCLEVTYGEDVGSTNAVVSLVQDIKLLPQFVPVTDDADSKFLNAEGKWVEVQTNVDHPVFEFTYDTTTNKATAEMVAGLASAITADKLILCNGRTYKFILEQDGMYGLVSDAYMDITDGKLKTSILAVMASSYDVQLMEEEVPVGTEITEETVRGWGFTKNAGTITGIKMNGATKGISGVVDLGNVLTEHQKLKDINGQSIVGEGNITIQGGGATPRVEMTAESASIEPNKFYVWPMMDALDLTLGAEQSGVMNRYLFQFRNPKAGLTMLTLPDTITWSEDTELDENGMPVMEAAAFYRIEIIEGLASLKKWKLVYINFADAEVERVLMSKGVGDGIGITKRDAAAVTDIGIWFKGNTIITSFEEIRFFHLARLNDNAFLDCTNLQGKIELPYATHLGNAALSKSGIEELMADNVLTTGNNPCSNCTSLKKVSIKSLKKIAYRMFYGDTELAEINISEEVTQVAQEAFYNCTSLGGDIHLPKCTTIQASAFYNTGITGLHAPLATSIGSQMCVNCKSLVNVYLPLVTSVPYRAFHSCTALQTIEVGEEVTKIDSEAFTGCSALAQDMVLPKCTTIQASAFYNTGITGLHAPLATSIGSQMCVNCKSLVNVYLPLVTSVPYRAFHSCTALQTIEVGEITEIGQSFNGCSALVSVIIHAVTPPTLPSNAFSSTNSTFIIYVPDASVEAYKAAMNWNTYADRIKGISEYTG